MPARRASQLYLVHFLIAGAALTVLIAAGVAVVGGLDPRLPSAQAIASACDSWLSSGGPGALLTLTIASLVLLSLLLGLRSASRQIRRARRCLAEFPLSGEARTPDGQQLLVIDSTHPQAFCAGFLRPRIYLSRGALKDLTAEELRAVIAHERHHLRRRDPLRLLLARSVAEALFFLPRLRRSSERYEALGELAADEAAVRQLEGRGPLASALLKFGSSRPETSPVVGIAPERVDHLLGDPEASRWRLPRSLAARSAIALAGLVALFALSLQLDPGPQLPLLLAAGCMVGMVGGPVLIALAAVRLSCRALRARRA
jgi:hypothetical protein